MESYVAGIVLYHPDIYRLKKNLDAVHRQVKMVYCYNNGLQDENLVHELMKKYNNVCLIGSGENLGIATALNKLLECADRDSAEWILTLDQDSVVCSGMVEALASLKNEHKVAVICPIIEDIRRKNEKPAVTNNKYEDVDFCITSGSFMNVRRTLEIGGYDDWLFIGLVDNEICYRMNLNGYRIIRNNAVVLNHELGNITPVKYEKFYLKIGDLLHNEAIKKLSYQREISPMRLYYATRNMLYLRKKYPHSIVEEWSQKQIFQNSFSSVLRGKNKIKLIRSIVQGIIDGNKISIGRN